MTALIDDIAAKIAAGEPLPEADARRLASTTDVVSVGMIAADARRRRVGMDATFVRVVELGVDAAPPDAWPRAAREIRLVGRPRSMDEALRIVRAARERSGGLPLTAFTLTDLIEIARADLSSAARSLRDAGAEAIAAVDVDRVADPAVIEQVLSSGLLLPVGRWFEPPSDPVAALQQVRALQEMFGPFKAFAPLPRAEPAGVPTTGYDDVKLVALTRVMLDNIEHVQVDWMLHGPKLAQVALLFGASDLDRVASSDDSPFGHRRAPLEEVRRNIEAAALRPVERDGRFDRVPG